MNRMPPAVEMDVVGGPKAEGARRATGAFGPTATSAATAPDPEVPAKAQRRRFTAAYRLRILKQADACKRAGELGALLRREGLYSSHLANWRRQREQGALRDMRGRRRGPTPRPSDPRVKQLEAENRRLGRRPPHRADPRDSYVVARDIRGPAYPGGVGRPGPAGEPQTGRALDAARRRAGRQSPEVGHDDDPRSGPAAGAGSGPAGIHRDRPGRALGGRHHLRRDVERLPLPGRGARCLESSHRGLGHGDTSADRTRVLAALEDHRYLNMEFLKEQKKELRTAA